jgi:hypothetical protein
MESNDSFLDSEELDPGPGGVISPGDPSDDLKLLLLLHMLGFSTPSPVMRLNPGTKTS